MRKLSMAILLLLILASCSRFSQIYQCEIVLTPSAGNMGTRGPAGGLSSSAEYSGEGTRLIYLSAYDVTDARNYFVGDTFQNKEGKWRCHKNAQLEPRYWPLSNKLRFLAYCSSCNPTVVWNPQDASGRIDIFTDEASLRDDILLAGTTELGNTVEPINILFEHTQTWLDVIISANMPETVTINKIILNDIYHKGHIIVENEDSHIACKWDFTKEKSSNFNMDIDEGNTLTSVDDKVSAYVMIPPQTAKDLLIEYKVGDELKSITVPNRVPIWEKGAHYTYKVVITPVSTKSGIVAGTEENINVELQRIPWS